MTNYDILEIENAYDTLVATRTEQTIPGILTYGCAHCGQNVGDLVAHRDVFHPDLAQKTNMQLTGITPLRGQRGK